MAIYDDSRCNELVVENEMIVIFKSLYLPRTNQY